jgi:hypothetical protein
VVIEEKQRSAELEISCKQLSEEVRLLRLEGNSLEEMNKRIQRDNHELCNEKHNLSRLLSNPREMNKDYLSQIDKMLKNFHEEREDQNKRHWIEKEKLKEMYEYEFRQKEMEMLRQIAVLKD